MLNRRFWIKEIVVASTGILLFPSCIQNDNKASMSFKNLDLSDKDEMLLANIVETIIPATDTKGAKELQVHLFILKMLNDCYVNADQLSFTNGLKKFKIYCQEKTGNSFEKNNNKERLTLFSEITSANSNEKELQYFLKTTKQLTILGYTQSQYIMTEINPYKLIPSTFNGCVKIKKAI